MSSYVFFGRKSSYEFVSRKGIAEYLKASVKMFDVYGIIIRAVFFISLIGLREFVYF